MTKKRLFISAAEPSGDIIAAELLKDLKVLNPDLTLSGIAGVNMQAEGVDSLFPMSDLSVMGFLEVLPKLKLISQRLKETTEHILAEQPSIVITVDAYSFHIRLAKKLRQSGFKGKLIHLVAPAVWAWKPKRAKKLSVYYDHVLCILPCEPPYFLPHGLKATYIGHPAVYRAKRKDPDFRQRFKISEDSKIINILPGSRIQEITKLLPIFLETATLLKQYENNLQVIIPTLPHLKSLISKLASPYNLPITLITDNNDKFASFHEGEIAIAASGTIAVELAQYPSPFIIAYKTSMITFWLAKKLARVRYICLINILRDKLIIPELLQDKCNPKDLIEAIIPMLKSQSYRSGIMKELALFNAQLHCPESNKTSSEYVATIVNSYIS